MNISVQCWDIFELRLNGPSTGNPFIDVSIKARFQINNRIITADGFYDGDGVYCVRFMPDTPGIWDYVTISDVQSLNDIHGSFECIPASHSNHGPVRVNNTYHFCYEDGTSYFPFGTTCYAWIHQGEALMQQTIETLKKSPFNKLRMCVFPKHFMFNENEPEYHPFQGSLEKGWDFTRFNTAFFHNLERGIRTLRDIGVEADLILFHPYDKWGYSSMDASSDDRYLKYVVSRLAAFRNIWWSIANEYDFVQSKTMLDWDRFFRIIQQYDPYHHLRSIHNGRVFYDHCKQWVTHCSIQSSEMAKGYEWRNLYKKPVVFDECTYEGNVHLDWGNITGEEMVKRFWEGFYSGCYVGHGETYLHPEDILWWSKGGVLHGSSPERISFLRSIIEDGPREGLTPWHNSWYVEYGCKEGEYYLMYFGNTQPAFKEVPLPENIKFKVDVIDTWNMTIDTLEGEYSGKIQVKLPQRPYMAIRARKSL